MTLDQDDLRVVRECLMRCSSELDAQMIGQGNYHQIGGTAWHACRYFRTKVDALLVRVEEELKS